MIPTILYLEDNIDIRDITTGILLKAGYKVISGSNGKAGLDLVKMQKFDIILTDILMPVMDGNEFILNISGNKLVPPIVAMSYKSSDIIPHRNITAVALKPLTSQSLIQTIQAAFNKSRPKLEKGAA